MLTWPPCESAPLLTGQRSSALGANNMVVAAPPAGDDAAAAAGAAAAGAAAGADGAAAAAGAEVVAAIDQGTQSTRVFLFDREGRAVASHQVPLKQIYPKAGWCEHDPLLIWQSVQDCVAGALAAGEAALGRPPAVKALGITNQRETTLLWRRSTGAPLHNAIVWLDNRTR